MQVFGVRPAGGDAASPPDGVAIRLARHDDLAAVAATQGRLIWDEQTAAPTFTGLTPPDWDTVLADWVETFSDDHDTVFIAERAGAIVGHTLLHAPPDAGLGWPAGAIQLATAAVVPGERGGGVGTALVTRALHWAAEQGHEVVIADWRIANLRASRFWPERGFRPAYHRMSRMTGIG
jgi:GNAT superfamily N-acetyltransferase